MLRRDREQARRQLELATTRSSTAGVLTWVVPREGSTVARGEVIARIADLDAFRVEAQISDVHSSRLRAGQAVRVRAAGQPLAGRLAQIDPTIESGAIKFTVDLAEPRNAGLAQQPFGRRAGGGRSQAGRPAAAQGTLSAAAARSSRFSWSRAAGPTARRGGGCVSAFPATNATKFSKASPKATR